MSTNSNYSSALAVLDEMLELNGEEPVDSVIKQIMYMIYVLGCYNDEIKRIRRMCRGAFAIVAVLLILFVAIEWPRLRGMAARPEVPVARDSSQEPGQTRTVR
jgi:hypothetical protein